MFVTVTTEAYREHVRKHGVTARAPRFDGKRSENRVTIIDLQKRRVVMSQVLPGEAGSSPYPTRVMSVFSEASDDDAGGVVLYRAAIVGEKP
jgi:hypothetical protein